MKKAIFLISILLIILTLPSCTEERGGNDTTSVTFILTMPRALEAGGTSDVASLSTQEWYYEATLKDGSFSDKERTGETQEPVALEMYGEGGYYLNTGAMGPFAQGLWEIEIYASHGGSKVLTTGKISVVIRRTATGTQTLSFILAPAEGEAEVSVQGIRTTGLGLGEGGKYILSMEYASEDDPTSFQSLLTTDVYETEDDGDTGAVTFCAEAYITTLQPGAYIFKAEILSATGNGDDEFVKVAGSTYSAFLLAGDSLVLSGDIDESAYIKVSGGVLWPVINVYINRDNAKEYVYASPSMNTNIPGTISYTWFVDGVKAESTSWKLPYSEIPDGCMARSITCIATLLDSEGNAVVAPDGLVAEGTGTTVYIFDK